MEEVKTEIKQIKNQILVGIKEDKIDHTWGMMIIENCNKALTLCGVSNSTVLEEPIIEKYGWKGATSFDEESGWMYEGGEDAYFEALKQWKAQQ